MSQPQQSSWATYKRLLRYAKVYWVAFIIAIIGNIGYSYADVTFISSLKPLMDESLVGNDTSLLKKAPFFILGLLFLRGIASFLSTYCMAWVGRNVVQKLREETFNHYLKLPAAFFDLHSEGELISLITYNTDRVARAATEAITVIVRSTAAIVSSLAYMLWMSWSLTLWYLLALPLIAVVVAQTSRRFRKVSKNIQNAMGDVTHVAEEGVGGYKVIKTFGGQEYEEERFQKAANKNRQQSMKLVATKAASVPFIQLIAGVAFAFVVYLAGQEFAAGKITAGDFTALLALMMFILKPIKDLTSVNSTLQEGIAGAESIFEVLDREVEPDSGTKTLQRAKGHIEFNRVDFSYPGVQEKVLEGINLTIEAGKTCALVGRSGSGKSTLTSLLLRFYYPDQGSILLDGEDISELTLENFRSHFAYVSQHVTLFNDTVRHNIAYGRQEKVSDDAIIEVAKKANAWEFIQQLPNGLDTQVGNDGLLLSGGQRQRIAIARALLKDAPVLILDEATSALDTESERYIQQALEVLMKERTTIVIAHRLSTIESADQIVVMREGRIVEKGTHKQLLEQSGEYARLHQIQFSESD